jgi:chromate transporter
VLSIFVLAAVLKYRLNVAIVIVVSGVVGAVAQWLA